MNPLKFFCRFVFNLAKQICLLPQNVAGMFRQHQRQTIRNEQEEERLDRIRNPSKYIGKP